MRTRVSFSLLNDPEKVFEEVPVTQSVTNAMHGISRESVPDLPDRVIAATARSLRVPVISADRRIRAAERSTIW